MLTRKAGLQKLMEVVRPVLEVHGFTEGKPYVFKRPVDDVVQVIDYSNPLKFNALWITYFTYLWVEVPAIDEIYKQCIVEETTIPGFGNEFFALHNNFLEGNPDGFGRLRYDTITENFRQVADHAVYTIEKGIIPWFSKRSCAVELYRQC